MLAWTDRFFWGGGSVRIRWLSTGGLHAAFGWAVVAVQWASCHLLRLGFGWAACFFGAEADSAVQCQAGWSCFDLLFWPLMGVVFAVQRESAASGGCVVGVLWAAHRVPAWGFG